jgi:hypothetical protein
VLKCVEQYFENSRPLEANWNMSRILSNIGYFLALIGGIIIVLYGFLGLLGTAFLIFTPILFLGGIAYSIVEILVGISASSAQGMFPLLYGESSC